MGMLAAAPTQADVDAIQGMLDDANADVMRLTGEVDTANSDKDAVQAMLTIADDEVIRLTAERDMANSDKDAVQGHVGHGYRQGDGT